MTALFAGVKAPTEMSINGLTCGLNMPERLESQFDASGNEIAQGLPPYAPRPAFNVDDYTACPAEWTRGSPKLSSFFVPIKVGSGMWLDLTMNTRNKHDVAAVISIQGVNAITALQTIDAKMEQYREKCPYHGTTFGSERHCPDCGFKWPAQNYVSTANGRSFWIDGFRIRGANGEPTGETRQFYFTEKAEDGIAAQLIGEERTFSIGVAFFLSKEPKPAPRYVDTAYAMGLECASASFGGAKGITRSAEYGQRSIRRFATSVSAPRVEIAGGAKINQDLGYDPNSLDYWQETPAGILVVNYVPEEVAIAIIEAGKRDRTAHGEGPLVGLRTGSPPGPYAKQ